MFLVLLIWLFISVMSGDVSLGRKGIVKSLTKGKGDQSAIFSFYTEGVNVLHVAASVGHLEVCKYLVEELGGDVNAPRCGALTLGRSLSPSSFFGGCHVNVCRYQTWDCVHAARFLTGVTPFMTAAQSGDVPTFKYFLDHGGDLLKADGKGRTVLHHAADTGASPDTHTLTLNSCNWVVKYSDYLLY
jgi:hypothetical protein